MFAAGTRAGGLTIVAGLAFASCSSLPLPALPNFFAPPEMPAELEPGLATVANPAGSIHLPGPANLTSPANPSANGERPAFFVLWKPDLPGITQRPRVGQNTPLPQYPAAAIRNDETGVTTLESCLTADGRLVDIHIVQSSGSKTLDDATLAWARTAKYQPAEFNGEAVAICGYRFDYSWRVETQR